VPPTLTYIAPAQGSSDIPNEVNVYGANFQPGAVVSLEVNSASLWVRFLRFLGIDTPTPLETTFLKDAHLLAVVPAGLNPDLYDVIVTNPDGLQATLPDAYTAINPASDDLFSYDYEFWTDPIVPIMGETAQIGLMVHRQGGKNPLTNVIVRFYDGDPAAGGMLIGDGVILLLSPRSFASTSGVNWTPPAEGDYTLYALIDPDGLINEYNEGNNQYNRVVAVPPRGPDQVAPHVDDFLIDGGAETTADTVVNLLVSASDPAPSSGLGSVIFIEFVYNQGAGYWIPVQNSGWIPYSQTLVGYDWTLTPTAGMKYLQAWAADNAGNVSAYPYVALINYLPPGDSVGANQTRLYRYNLEAGQSFSAQVHVLSGDPDLYVWAPDWEQGRPAWVSNQSVGDEEVSFLTPISGEYQVEVYGYTAATYQLTVQITQTAGERMVIQSDKVQPSQPVLALNDLPGQQVALPPLKVLPLARIYLPIVVR
jgi:hypothetical protein